MKLEVGKFYKTRDGRKVGPMIYAGYIDSNMAFNCVDGCGWTPHGTEYNYAESENDLVAEWQDEPEVEVGNSNENNIGELIRKINDKAFRKSLYEISPDEYGRAPQSTTTRAQILDTAKQYVTQDRHNTHGKPEDTFGLIAELWGAYLGRAIAPVEVCTMMALLKIARSADNPTNADNWIDLAGYAACAGELAK